MSDSRNKRATVDARFLEDVSNDTTIITPLTTKLKIMEELRDYCKDNEPELLIASLTDIKDARPKLKDILMKEKGKVVNQDEAVMDEILEEIAGFGVIERIIRNPNVTDITYNGTDLVIETNAEKKINDTGGLVTPTYIKGLVSKYATSAGMSKEFNGSHPIIDAVVGNMRINAVHEDSAQAGITLAIRVSHTQLLVTREVIGTMAPPYVGEMLLGFVKCQCNIVASGKTGTGKSLDNNTLIPTPDGYKLMGDLKENDYVFDRNGKPTKITGVYPQGKKEAYEVVFADGRTIVCNDEHLWPYFRTTGRQSQSSEWKVATLGELMDKGITKTKEAFGHTTEASQFAIPTSKAVEFNVTKSLSVDPYAMGAFIGDGSLTSVDLRLSSEDEWIPNKVSTLLGASGTYKASDLNYDWNFSSRTSSEYTEANELRLKTTDVFGEYPEVLKLSLEKSIPSDYKYASIEDRWKLIQGLFDTDGTIRASDRYNVGFSTNSELLAYDVQEVLWSLGVQSTVKVADRKDKKNLEYTVNVNCANEDKYKFFTLPRKLERAERAAEKHRKKKYDRMAIREVRNLNKKVEMTCIMVDNDEHLFLAGDYIVTHNTELSKYLISEIPFREKIALIEDVAEMHAKDLFPDADIHSWVAIGAAPVAALLRASLRNNPEWVVVTELRSGNEAVEWLQAIMSDHRSITSLHAASAIAIPNRIIGMYSEERNVQEERLEQNILGLLNIGIQLEARIINGKKVRFISEVMEYRPDDEGGSILIFKQRMRNNGERIYSFHPMSEEMRNRIDDWDGKIPLYDIEEKKYIKEQAELMRKKEEEEALLKARAAKKLEDEMLSKAKNQIKAEEYDNLKNKSLDDITEVTETVQTVTKRQAIPAKIQKLLDLSPEELNKLSPENQHKVEVLRNKFLN